MSEADAQDRADEVEVFDFSRGRAGWQREYDEFKIRSSWFGPIFTARAPGWLGFRWRTHRYYVLRDSKRYRPLFSEREGIRPFHLIAQIGRWQLGAKP